MSFSIEHSSLVLFSHVAREASTQISTLEWFVIKPHLRLITITDITVKCGEVLIRMCMEERWIKTPLVDCPNQRGCLNFGRTKLIMF